jgi:hypothetical protein
MFSDCSQMTMKLILKTFQRSDVADLLPQLYVSSGYEQKNYCGGLGRTKSSLIIKELRF